MRLLAEIRGVDGRGIELTREQAQVAIAHEVIRIVGTFRDTGEVPNVVNRLARSSATHVLSIRHRNRPGVLAHVFGVLAGGAINVEEVENIIYHGAQATLARIHLDGVPDGFEFELPADNKTYQLLTEWAFQERLCCPFFDIDLRLDRENGPLWLRLTGRPGTKEFIKEEFGI